jgi:hypothetical protein
MAAGDPMAIVTANGIYGERNTVHPEDIPQTSTTPSAGKVAEYGAGGVLKVGDAVADNDAVNKNTAAALIASALAGFEKVTFQKVDTLPGTGEAGIIYLVGTEAPYEEYIWINGAFDSIGSGNIDLSGFLPKETYIDDNNRVLLDPAPGGQPGFSVRVERKSGQNWITENETVIAGDRVQITQDQGYDAGSTTISSYPSGMGLTIRQESYSDSDAVSEIHLDTGSGLTIDHTTSDGVHHRLTFSGDGSLQLDGHPLYAVEEGPLPGVLEPGVLYLAQSA